MDSPLRTLLSSQGELRRAYHGTRPVLLRNTVPVAALPSTADIGALIDASLLKWPYFTVLQDGVLPPPAEVRMSRRVGAEVVDDFIRPEGVRQQLAAGATLKLSQVEDWHPLTRRLVRELCEVFPAETKAFLFLTPAGKRGMLPHRDGSRVIVIQIEGAKEWHLYHTEGVENPDPGLDVDPDSEVATHVLRQGDLLYLPHGYGHAATAVGETSLHLTFTLIEPTPKALLQAFVERWMVSPGMSASLAEDRGMSIVEKVGAVLAELEKHAHDIDGRDVLDHALASAMRREKP